MKQRSTTFPQGQVKICTTVNRDDVEYCEKHNLMYSQLLRGAIRDHKVHENEPDVVLSSRETNKKLKFFQETLEKMRDFMQEKGVLNEYIDKL